MTELTRPVPEDAANVMIVELVEEVLWMRALLGWCRPRLKLPAYQERLDEYLASGPSPAPVDEPRIIHSEIAEAEPHG